MTLAEEAVLTHTRPMRFSLIVIKVSLLLLIAGCSQIGAGGRNSIPDWVYPVGFLLIFSAGPAAFGASISYHGPRLDEKGFKQTLWQGASLPAGLGTLLGCGAASILFLSEILNHSGGNLSPMAGIVLCFMVLALIIGSFVVAAAAGVAGGYGARLGAGRGKPASVLGAALGAMIGAAVVPLLLSLG